MLNTADSATLCGAKCYLNYGSHCVVPLYCVNTATSTTNRQTKYNGGETHGNWDTGDGRGVRFR